MKQASKHKKRTIDNNEIARQLVAMAKELISQDEQEEDGSIFTAGIDVASVTLTAARKYAEDAFSKANIDLEKALPDFDENFALLKSKMSSAKDIPRVQMPVIEPGDMALFNKRLKEGSIDIFKPFSKGKFHAPKTLSGKQGKEWVSLGFQDGDKSDDRLGASLKNMAAKKMKPTQSQIWFDKIINNIIKFGVPASGGFITSQTIITSKEGFILDGHHRFGQVMMADPSIGMKVLEVPLKIDLLVRIGKSYGEAIGNKSKA